MGGRQAATGQVFLTTERLVLRQFTAADVDLLVELDSDPAVMHFITGGRPTPRSEIEQEVLPHFLAFYDQPGGYGFWAVVDKVTGGARALIDARFTRPGVRRVVAETLAVHDVEYELRRGNWEQRRAGHG